MKHPLEMIAEWEKGCSNANSTHPEDCPECTKELIEAIKKYYLWEQQFTTEVIT